ncbi:MAG: ATP-binding cassette domain-containing protein, partial [Firmicutes bacterium]|nr:ATP-binding cassette domain-containing protein [Bacillota bacterium]
MAETFIELNHVSFSYTDEEGNVLSRPLQDVNMTIKRGSFVAVLGKNGSGKSTLAKHLNALLPPDEGDVIVNGMNTKDQSLIWEIRKSCGMVFQNPDNQLVSSVVEDDVAFGPENLGVPSDEIRQRVDMALNAVGMYEHRKKGPHLLSGGQKQRIANAGVLAMNSECIVFDEPTAMLDPKGRREIMEIIEKLHESGKTIVLITHFM